MIGVKVSYGCVLYATRRQTGEVYSFLFPISAVPPVDDQVPQADDDNEGVTPTCNDFFTLLQPLDEEPMVYADACCLGATARGFLNFARKTTPGIADDKKQDTINAIVENTVDNTLPFLQAFDTVGQNQDAWADLRRSTLPIMNDEIVKGSHTVFQLNPVRTAPVDATRLTKKIIPERNPTYAGVGPPQLTHRIAEGPANAGLRAQLYNAVRQAGNELCTELPIGRRSYLRNNCNRLFTYINDDARFAAILLRETPEQSMLVNRMLPANFNRPQPPGNYVINPERPDGCTKAVLCRSLNRLVNDRIMTHSLLPEETIEPANSPIGLWATVTRQEAAEHFLHISQRAFFSDASFNLGLDVLDDEKEYLRQLVAAFV
jgi:hypothetical protein